MTASPATAVWWGGVPAADLVADAHLLAAVDEALAGSGTGAELVSLHEDRPAPGSRTGVRIGVALRLTGEPADPAAARSALERALSGPVLPETGADGSEDAAAPACTALAQAGAGTSGRVVRFPGQATVRGQVSVADLVATTGIDRVRGLYGPVADTDVVETGPRGFLRPRWEDGELVLLVEPVAGGLLQPFEIESPHQCCDGQH